MNPNVCISNFNFLIKLFNLVFEVKLKQLFAQTITKLIVGSVVLTSH